MNRFVNVVRPVLVGIVWLTCGWGRLFADVPAEARTYFVSDAYAGTFTQSLEGRSHGVSNGMLLAFGGRNAEGQVSDLVEVLSLKDGEVMTSATLSQPVAFAAAVSHQNKIYLVGGLGPQGITDRVLSLEWTAEGLVEEVLPPLPEAVMMAGVAVHRSTVHYFLEVLGGVNAVDATVASDRMYELEFGLPGAEWVLQQTPPFEGRVLPTFLETYNEVVMLGGYEFKQDGALSPATESWGFSRVPRDGHQTQGWEPRTAMPVTVARAAVAQSGQSHLLVAGGDSASTTLPDLLAGAPPKAPTSGVWAYHDPFDVWHQIGELDEASAQGYLAPVSKPEFVMIDGRSAAGDVSPSTRFQFQITTKKMSWPDWVMLGAYFVAVAMIGIHFSRKQRNAESFALGNRETNWLAATISLMASGVSTISFMALPALTACIGLANSGAMVFMLLGMFISGHITYPILRRLKITSTFEYIEQRFGPSLRLVGSFNSIVVQMMGRIGIVVLLPALAISTMIGLPPWFSILAMGVVTTIYSATGGFEAVVWTDVLQGILLLFGFVAIGILATGYTDGGLAGMWADAAELNRNNFFLTKMDVRIQNIYFAVFGFTLQIMAFASDQVTAQRVLCIPMKHVRKLAYLGGFFGVLIAWLSAFVGMSLFGFFRDQPQFLNPVMQNDQLVPIFIVNMIPVGLAGLILATLFAAAMSTVSSSVNVCGVLVAEDFYKKFSKKVTPKKEMRVMQISTVVSGIIGTGMALWLLTMDLPTLWEAFMRIMAYIGGGFGGIFILGMFTRRAHELGAILGVVTSFGMAWFFNTSDLNVHYSALGLFITLSCVIVGYVSSLIIPWKRRPLAGLTVWDQLEDQVDDAELEQKLAEAN